MYKTVHYDFSELVDKFQIKYKGTEINFVGLKCFCLKKIQTNIHHDEILQRITEMMGIFAKILK